MAYASWVYDRHFVPFKLTVLIDTARDYGVAASDLLVGTGIREDQLASRMYRTSVAQYVRAYENLLRYTHDTNIPARMADQMHLYGYGIYGYTLMCSLTIRHMLESAIRYHRLAAPIYETCWSREQDAFSWRLLEPYLPLEDSPARDFLLVQQICHHAVHMRDGLGIKDYAPRLVRLPARLGRFEESLIETFGCPLDFGAAAPEIVHDITVLDTPTVFAHDLTSIEMQAQCDRQLAEYTVAAGAAHRIYKIVKSDPAEVPPMDALAARLKVSARTLRRQLSDEGTTYENIVDIIRASTACEHLRAGAMSIEAIGGMVGFGDTANFRRAFRRWTGMSPREFRASNALQPEARQGGSKS